MGTFAPCAGAGPGPVHELAIACSVAPRLHDRNAHRGQNPATPPIARRATIMTAIPHRTRNRNGGGHDGGEATPTNARCARADDLTHHRRGAAITPASNQWLSAARPSSRPTQRSPRVPRLSSESHTLSAARPSSRPTQRSPRVPQLSSESHRLSAARSSSRHNPRSRITLSQHTALDVPGRTGRRASLTNHSEWRTSGEMRPRPPAGAVLGMLRTLLSATLRRRASAWFSMSGPTQSGTDARPGSPVPA